MRSNDTTSQTIRIEREPGDPLPVSDTDWAAVDAKTDEELTASALADLDSQPIPSGTDEELVRIGLHRIVNVGRLRKRLGMTQETFAARYRIPVGTLRDWEQGRKMPDAPARAYLLVIEKDPETVAGLLGSAA
jgi:putative transcriptional regulator